jgi:hypothetical protein
MESNTKKYFWNHAGTAGILLGLISSTVMFIGQYFSTVQMSNFWALTLSGILWLAETVGCVGLMYIFMKKFTLEYPEAEAKQIFRLGSAIAFLSATVYATVTFANIAYISADYYSAQFDLALQQLSSSLDSNSRSLIESAVANMPQIAFVSNLIYCTIFGTVISSIITRGFLSKTANSENTIE